MSGADSALAAGEAAGGLLGLLGVAVAAVDGAVGAGERAAAAGLPRDGVDTGVPPVEAGGLLGTGCAAGGGSGCKCC